MFMKTLLKIVRWKDKLKRFKNVYYLNLFILGSDFIASFENWHEPYDL